MLALSLLAVLATADPTITLEGVLAQRRAGPAELRAEAELGEARRAVAEVAARQREAPVVAFEAGPRRTAGSTAADVAVDLELALLRRGGERGELVDALATAEGAVRSAARATTVRTVRDAYVDAWAAAERVRLRERDAALVERWLALARRRVEAGADPPFEAEIVAAQLQGARLALAQARTAALGSWEALRAWATLPEALAALAEPSTPASLGPAALDAGAMAGVVAVRARARLAAGLLRLGAARGLSRWSLSSSLAREGDEDVAHLGFSLRWPRQGEEQAIRSATEAEVRAVEREAEVETTAIAARAAAARALLRELDSAPGGPDLEAILAALEARLAEGKDRPVEALPLRREVLVQLEEALDRRIALHRAAAVLAELTTEVAP
jgi:hypothetical protein